MQVALAKEGVEEVLTQRRTAKAVRQRKGKAAAKRPRLSQVFVAQSGIKVAVTAKHKVSYHDVQQALQEAIVEVQLRIDNNVQIY